MNAIPVCIHTQGFLILLIWALASYASPSVYTSKELMMYFQVRCNFRCKYGYETDVEGRPLCKCYDPCKNIYCLGGAKCVIEMPKSCLWQSCRPNATCKVRHGQSGEDKPALHGAPQADAATASASTARPSVHRNSFCLLPLTETDKNCRRMRKRWRFDPDSGKCVKFRGCKSDGNNFGRKKRCKRKCMKKTKSRRKWRGGRSRGSRRRPKH